MGVTPEPINMPFWLLSGVPNVITHAKFGFLVGSSPKSAISYTFSTYTAVPLPYLWCHHASKPPKKILQELLIHRFYIGLCHLHYLTDRENTLKRLSAGKLIKYRSAKGNKTTQAATYQLPSSMWITFLSTFLGDRSSRWLLSPTGDSEYGDDAAATGLAEFNRYYNKQKHAFTFCVETV